MSYQSKEMSIGYILKAMIDAGSHTKELVSLYYKLDEAMNEHIEANKEQENPMPFDNYTTYDFMVFINREQGMEEEQIQKIGSNLYYAYDMYTVEEAEEFYHSFKKILRIR